MTEFEVQRGALVTIFLFLKFILDNKGSNDYNITVKAIAMSKFAWPLLDDLFVVISEGGKYKCLKSMCVKTNLWRAL